MAGCCVAALMTAGCEVLQQKFTRKPKHPSKAPNPIIQFQDYTRAMTPLDRYQKHYLMFDYWNHELLETLQTGPLNPKRLRRSSGEALAELEQLKALLAAEQAAKMAEVIDERAQLNKQLQSIGFGQAQVHATLRALEAQTRQINRDFFWRDMADHVQAPAEPELKLQHPLVSDPDAVAEPTNSAGAAEQPDAPASSAPTYPTPESL
jgi:hypothetical protein